jgi:hypothetical protein
MLIVILLEGLAQEMMSSAPTGEPGIWKILSECLNE